MLYSTIEYCGLYGDCRLSHNRTAACYMLPSCTYFSKHILRFIQPKTSNLQNLSRILCTTGARYTGTYWYVLVRMVLCPLINIDRAEAPRGRPMISAAMNEGGSTRPMLADGRTFMLGMHLAPHPSPVPSLPSTIGSMLGSKPRLTLHEIAKKRML